MRPLLSSLVLGILCVGCQQPDPQPAAEVDVITDLGAPDLGDQGLGTQDLGAPDLETRDLAAQYPNVLTLVGAPEGAEDWSLAVLADQGSWLGFALPPPERAQMAGGFTGPFLMTTGRWLSEQLATLSLHDSATDAEILLRDLAATAHPGSLRRSGVTTDLAVEQRLWFDSDRRALLHTTLRNAGAAPRTLDVTWSGSVHPGQATLDADSSGVSVVSVDGLRLLLRADRPTVAATIDGSRYHLALRDTITLDVAEQVHLTLLIEWAHPPEAPPVATPVDPELSWDQHRERWDRYLTAVGRDGANEDPLQILAVKAVQTLVSNWRGPAGRLRHSALFPSSNVWYFNGFWAWDSWKHAVGLARFDPLLAQEQIRAMFDHQDEHGMVADVVYLDAAEDNWRDTKPPLAGWAVETVHAVTGDLDFVSDLYPKLVAYHAFWYADRDHDGDGLCEYGSTDGTLVAARWESGMDNAVRFDATTMLQNSSHAWSMNQESVDLNSYLYRDKLALAALATALGREDEAQQWRDAAETLRRRIQQSMFDAQSGWFYDTDISSGEIIEVQGPEGWTPLWTGVATPEQAAAVRQTMLDPGVFRTHIPFPTVARDHPEFSDGYWRGLVWLDQVYFAIDGLRRYGYEADAVALTEQVITNLAGAASAGAPLFENYHPLTGAGQNVKHFSWSAAHLLLLSLDQPAVPTVREERP